MTTLRPISRSMVVASVFLLLAAVVVVALGARERDASPRYPEYVQVQTRQSMTTPDGKEAHNPAGRAALVFSTTAAFDTCCSGFVALWFGFGLLATRAAARSCQPVRLGVVVAFALGCFLVAFWVSEDAAKDYRWEFNILAVGQTLTAIGLVLGGLGTVGSALTSTQAQGSPKVE